MDGFRLIYERYYQDVLRFALFLTGDRVRAGDLAADTFVRAWMARDDIGLGVGLGGPLRVVHCASDLE